jgi:hypothetical protein
MDAPQVSETRVTLLLAVCLVIGALLGIAAMTVIFPLAPTELSRTTVILHALRGPGAKPSVAVLGNSVIMNGIDARRLTPAGSAWNLGSTGQELSESLLLTDALPPSVRTIVIGISPDEVRLNQTSMPRNKYVAYIMSGYTPSAGVIAIAEQLQDKALYQVLRTNRFQVVTWSRWVVRALADLVVRTSLRKDLNLERARTDLYFPAPYLTPVSAATLDHLLAINYKDFRARFVPQHDTVSVLKGINNLAAARGKHVVFLVMPEHPRRRATSSPQFYADFAQWVRTARAEGLDIIDIHDALGAGDFIDHIHPGGSGTTRFTQLLDDNLRRTRS